MISTIIASIKQFLSDRTTAVLALALLITGLGYIVYVALSLEPSDLQVATRYTAFGDTHFYRNKWHYLIGFCLFGVTVVASHTALAVKFYAGGQRQLSIFLLSLALLVLIVGLVIARSVLGIAFL